MVRGKHKAMQKGQISRLLSLPFRMKTSPQLKFPPESVSPLPRRITFCFCYEDE